MEKIFIIRNIEKIGNQKIALTDAEIEKIAREYNNCQKNIDKEYYKSKLLEMLKNEYSEKFSKYMLNEHGSYINQLADNCYYNQDSIDNIGITFIFDLERNLREIVNEYYSKMYDELKLDEFIKDLIDNFENFSRSDLQAIVQARCIKTGENENEILNQIDNKIKGE